MISERGGFITNRVDIGTLVFYCVFKSTEENTAALEESVNPAHPKKRGISWIIFIIIRWFCDWSESEVGSDPAGVPFEDLDQDFENSGTLLRVTLEARGQIPIGDMF